MRFYKKYSFPVGNKLGFKNLFATVDDFLHNQSLHYDSLGYYLEGIGDCCQKLTQKMPQLVTADMIAGADSCRSVLTNLLNDISCDEELIRHVGSKIPRPYRFSEASFYYRNINFFEKQPLQCVAQKDERNGVKVFGSYIQLRRGYTGPSSMTVVMSVEVHGESDFCAADRYASTFGEYLGMTEFISGFVAYLDDTERTAFSRIQEETLPLLKSAREDLYCRAEQVREDMLKQFPRIEYKRYNSRSIIRRLGNKFGFDQEHNIPGFGTYFCKKVSGGVFLTMLLINGSGINIRFALHGPGFCYWLADLSGHPENALEANYFIERMLALTKYFEDKYMDSILVRYPAYPDWYPFWEE